MRLPTKLLYTAALREYLARHQPDAVTEVLDAVYAAEPSRGHPHPPTSWRGQHRCHPRRRLPGPLDLTVESPPDSLRFQLMRSPLFPSHRIGARVSRGVPGAIRGSAELCSALAISAAGVCTIGGASRAASILNRSEC